MSTLGIIKGFLFLLLLLPVLAEGQGIPLIQNISPEDYQNNRQNWALAQDSSGLMFIGNSAGLLTYDGVEWGTAYLSKPVEIKRTLFLASDHNVYYGGFDDFGYITSDSLGNVALHSLHDEHGLDSLNYGYIWRTAEFNGSIYFQTPDYLLRYKLNTGSVEVIEADQDFDQLLTLGERMITRFEGKGFYEIDGDKFTEVEGSGLFSDDKVFSIENFESHSLVFSREHGITEYRNGRFTPVKNRASRLVSDFNIYRTTKLQDGQIAIATLKGGVLIIDESGKLLNIIDEEKGLSTNIVYDVFADSESTLWAALDNGLSRIYLNKPVTRIDERAGLKGIITNIVSVDSSVYAGSTEGLYTIKTDLNSNFLPEINKVPGVARIYDVTRAGSKLIAADPEGVKVVENGMVTQSISQVFTHLYSSGENPVIYLTSNNTIHEADTQNRLEPELLVSHSDRISDLILYRDKLWVLDNEAITEYGLDGRHLDGYPFPESPDQTYFIEQHDGIFLIGTIKGLYLMNPDEGVIYKDDSIEDDDVSSQQVSVFESCNERSIWLRAGRKIKQGRRTQPGWEFEEALYKDIARKPNESVYDIECLDETIWFSGTDGVYLLKDNKEYIPAPFYTRVTGVFVRNDSLLYGGFQDPEKTVALPYRDNELRFAYAAGSYLNPAQNRYQVMLEGFDSDWSTWTLETQKDYTNLPEGQYTFKVRSRNQYDAAGLSGSFSFEILPPWYRTWWAYFLYLFVICSVLYTIHKIRINQILKIQRMRNRIASDLHDEVSATLISIGYFAEAIGKQNPEMAENRFMKLITTSAEQAKDKIKDIIWVINPDHDDWEELIARCRKYAADLLESKNIRHTFDFPENVNGKPSLEVRQHFWLIYKELVTNAVRHSEADEIKISIQNNSDHLNLTVEDDGSGFDTSILSKGNGMKNLKKRAASIKAELKIESEAGKGTRSQLAVPV